MENLREYHPGSISRGVLLDSLRNCRKYVVEDNVEVRILVG